MPRAVVLEEFHLTVTAPRGLGAAEYDAIRRTLDARGFRAGLRRAARGVFRRHPALARARFALSR
jgi:hypothetical protein